MSLQGEFGDARDHVAQEFASAQFNQSALSALLHKMGPQNDERVVFREFNQINQENPEMSRAVFRRVHLSEAERESILRVVGGDEKAVAQFARKIERDEQRKAMGGR